MAKHNSPPSDPDSDAQPSDTLPDGYRVIRLPAWEFRPQVAPVPTEEEGGPADKRKREFWVHPFNRRSSTSVNPPMYHGDIPIKYHPDPIHHTHPRRSS